MEMKNPFNVNGERSMRKSSISEEIVKVISLPGARTFVAAALNLDGIPQD